MKNSVLALIKQSSDLMASEKPKNKDFKREDVIDCYKKFLGREPESEAAIASHLELENFRALVDVFLNSEEFKARTAKPLEGPSRIFYPVGKAVNQIETSVDSARLAKCLERVKETWSGLGESQPHHSVLTNEKFLPEHVAKNMAGFRNAGIDEVADVLLVIKRYFEKDLRTAVLNELGSGVGRVTIPFASHFNSVNGYDISRPHLLEAQKYADEMGLANINFHELHVGELPSLAMCDVFYSRIVLQHNPPPLIMELIKIILKSVRPGGLAVFQVPTFILGYKFSLSDWLQQPNSADMEMHCVPINKIFDEINAHNFVVREVREDFSTGSTKMISNTFVVQKV